MSARSTTGGAALLGILALAAAGCGPALTEMTPLTIHSVRPTVAVDTASSPRDAVFLRSVAVARAHGYEPDPIQRTRARFGIRARHTDRDYEYRIAIECLADQSVRITPIGGRVELHEGRYVLPEPLRDEIAVLAQALREIE